MKPANWTWDGLIRSNILQLEPYRCARDDYSAGILLDANENAIGHSIVTDPPSDALNLNRYPDPYHPAIKEKLANLRGCQAGTDGVFLGVGSDEIIDLLMRITCTPGKDSIMVSPPTYGMYSVCAAVNDVTLVKVPLNLNDGNFLPQIDQMTQFLSTTENPPKLVFLTSPGNPTGTAIPPQSLKPLLEHPTWKGLVVVDEAYIDFANVAKDSAVSLYVTPLHENIERTQLSKHGLHSLNEGYQNLIVLQTLSKGFGLAGIRLGFSFQQPELTRFMSSTKAPYNISTPTADIALKALSAESLALFQKNVNTLVKNRDWLYETLQTPRLQSLGVGAILGRKQSNFLLVRILDKSCSRPDNERSSKLYTLLAETKGVVVRFRGKEPGCEGCLRITVGTDSECEQLIERMCEVLQEI